ncbi:MAG: cyclase family protein [Ekhidna sp.]
MKHSILLLVIAGLPFACEKSASDAGAETQKQFKWPEINNDEDIIAILPQITNWGKWGPNDEKGTLNYITQDKILQASKLIQSGKSISLSRQSNLATTPGVREGSYQMQKGRYGSRDFVGAVWHGFAVTHLDGLAHVFADTTQMYNGFSIDSLRSEGAKVLGIENFSGGIVGKGVLIDVPNYLERDLEPGFAITPALLEEVLERQKTLLSSGDIVFVRTGLGEKNTRERRAGLHPGCIVWAHKNQITLLGGDGDNDAHPIEGFDRYSSTFHTVGIPYLGLPLIDNANLEELSSHCKEINRYQFFITINPWRIEGTTSSPVNPVAIF